MLIITPTPIGNLEDITLRAKSSLETCDYILCEDTKVTKNLLFALDIQKKLIPFHKFNEKRLEEQILSDLQSGMVICLVSDAGTPGINDPGTSLIAACHTQGIQVNVLPGPSAVISAVALSGIAFDKFQFLGFFPKSTKEQRKEIEQMVEYDGVSVFFESPKRAKKSITLLLESFKQVYVAKELSKIHEALLIIDHENMEQFNEKLTKGEMCLLVKGKKKEAQTLEKEDAFIMDILLEYHSKRDAATIAAKLTGKKKQCFYSL